MLLKLWLESRGKSTSLKPACARADRTTMPPDARADQSTAPACAPNAASALAVYRDAEGRLVMTGVEISGEQEPGRMSMCSPRPISPGSPISLRGLSAGLTREWETAVAVVCESVGDRWQVGLARSRPAPIL
jgi:hypothetical protein